MALIKCPECEKNISDTALACPNCGYSLKKEITVKSNMAKIGSILNIVGNLIPLALCLTIGFSGIGEEFQRPLFEFFCVSGVIIIVNILYLINLIKRKYLKIYGLVLVILNLILISAITNIPTDCSFVFFIICLCCSLLGTLLILIEGFKTRNV